MKTTVVVSALLLAASANASWFGGDDKPEYESWDTQKLHHWLESNSIAVPDSYGKKDLKQLVAANWESHKPWTQAMYEAAKPRYEGLQASAFDTWDESRLRNFLLEQGLVEPKGPREQLVLAAKKQYNAYTNAAASLASRASTAASTAVYGDATYQASKSASSLSSEASKSASSVSGWASPSASSIAAEASKSAAAAYASASVFANRKMDDTKDYVWSTWDDNRMRSYLEDKGIIKTKQQATRDELIAKMKASYVSTTDPVWQAWSDSYIHEWLVAHGVLKSEAQKKREEYEALLKQYYYAPQQKVWSTWSDSELKAWLVKNGYVKSDAQIKREKAEAIVAKNWYSAKDTVWSAWSDNSMKQWLIDHGYMRSDAQVKRDELIKLMNEKYTDTYHKSAEYLTWPDARLRAYLRNWGVDDTQIIGRPSLLQEVRIRYYQANNKVEQMLAAIRASVYSSMENAEATLSQILETLTGKSHEAKDYANDKYGDAKAYADQKSHDAKAYAADKAAEKAASAEAAAASARKEAERKKSEL
ncbi:hypothetical protein FS837_008826 [Tulasnella sp. UAMH 9824]|nr:hypothetical protein FS837_008826 [Tulasnella sp. UAMH 9824]